MNKIKILELFAGSKSVGNVASQEFGMEVFSVDINNFEGIDLVKDIMGIVIADIPFCPDIIWASPPCTTYSIAAISHHRLKGGHPKSEDAIVADKVVLKTLEIIGWFPAAKYFIENPVGMLRKMDFMQALDAIRIYYCRYGDIRMKPTDIFSNHIRSMYNPNGWQPRRKCWNGNKKCHHEAAPRGSKTGTQGLAGSYNRSKVPVELIRDILSSVV